MFNRRRIRAVEEEVRYLRAQIREYRDDFWKTEANLYRLTERLGLRIVQSPAKTTIEEIEK